MSKEHIRSDSRSSETVTHLNHYLLSKQIARLLRSVQPHVRSADLKVQLQQFVRGLISETEWIGFEYMLRSRMVCKQLEKGIPDTQAAIFCYDLQTMAVNSIASPNMPAASLDLSIEYYNANPTIHSTLNYDMKVVRFFHEPRWQPYRHFLRQMNITCCWVVPLHRSMQTVCTLVLFLNDNKEPNADDLKRIEGEKQQFNHWLRAARK